MNGTVWAAWWRAIVLRKDTWSRIKRMRVRRRACQTPNGGENMMATVEAGYGPTKIVDAPTERGKNGAEVVEHK